MDDDVRDLFQVDVRDVAPRSSASFNIDIQDDMPDYTYFYDEWGIGWKMPKVGGLYYDMFHHPLQGRDLHRRHRSLSVARTRPIRPGFTACASALAMPPRSKGRAWLSAGCAQGSWKWFAWLRGFEDYYMDFAGNTKLLEYFLDKLVELKMAYWEKALAEGGDYISAIVEADDMAGQNGMLISPRAYRNIVKPRHKRLFDFIKARTRAKIFFHSCGAVRKVIPDLIEAGIDILNPVQVSAAGMDSARTQARVWPRPHILGRSRRSPECAGFRKRATGEG